MNKKVVVLLGALFLGASSAGVFADDDDYTGNFNNTQNCVGTPYVDGDGNAISIDDKFGAGTLAATRCLAKPYNAKVLYQINTECKNAKCDEPFAIGNIMNHIKDFEMTHGMSSDDYEFVVIVHSAGWRLALNDERNPFPDAMKALLQKPSVKVLYCLNTANSKKLTKNDFMEGVGFVTAGVSAIADLQRMGYRYVQP